MTRMPCGCSTDEPTVCLAHALPSNGGEPCDHSVEGLEGRYISQCCGAYPIDDAYGEDRKAGMPATGFCQRCHDHAVFDIECEYCGEIVELPRS